MSNLTVLPISSEDLLDLLTICFSCLCLWVSLSLLLLICLPSLLFWLVTHLPFRRHLPGFCWILLLLRSTCLVYRAVSSLWLVSWMASLGLWSPWHNLSVTLLCWWSVHTGCNTCMQQSFWFVLWHWGWSFWSLVGGTSTSAVCRSYPQASPFLLLFWSPLLRMAIVSVWWYQRKRPCLLFSFLKPAYFLQNFVVPRTMNGLRRNSQSGLLKHRRWTHTLAFSFLPQFLCTSQNLRCLRTCLFCPWYT